MVVLMSRDAAVARDGVMVVALARLMSNQRPLLELLGMQ